MLAVERLRCATVRALESLFALAGTPELRHLIGRIRTPAWVAWAAQQAQRVREEVVVLIAAFISLVVHGHFILPGLGEQDAARFARIAYFWHSRGKIAFDDVGYQIRTSTLYLQSEKLLLDHGLPMHSLPNWVNWAAVGFGTAYSVAFYALCRRITTRPIAVAATLMHALTPAFWLGNLYGMPTVPGMFFFIVALILFLDASRLDQAGFDFYLRLFGALLSMTLAMMNKSDVALGGGAFLGVAFARPTQRVRFACYAGAIVVGGTLCSIAYAHAVVLPSHAADTAAGGLMAFLKNWNKAFEVDFEALLDDNQNSTISRCVGGLLFCVIVLSICYGLVIGGRFRKQTLLALLWGLPPILAWGIRYGNSARHNVPAFPPLVLIGAIFLFEIVKYDVRRASALVVLTVAASYCSNSSGENSLRPQSNLLRLSETMARFTRGLHRGASAIADSPEQNKAIVGGYVDAYTEFEVLSRMQHPVFDISGDTWVITDGDRTTIIDYTARNGTARTVARKYRQRGFEPFSLSFRF
jgi:hypothetical protein